MPIEGNSFQFNNSSAFSAFSLPAQKTSVNTASSSRVGKTLYTKNKPSVLQKTKAYLKIYKELPDEDKKELKNSAKKLGGILETLAGSMMFNITDFVFSVIFLNFGIYYLQKYVNSKFLINFLDKKFTQRIKDIPKIEELALKMRKEHGLKDKVKIVIQKGEDAYYTPEGNKVVLGEMQKSAAFHELGHAVIENNTKVLSLLQNGRGNYARISMMLNALVMGHNEKESNNKNKNKFSSFLSKYPASIPLLAYSPELITEFGASAYGLNFLKKELKQGNITKNLFSNIKKSYITCFATYLFIPLSIILVSYMQKLNNKAVKSDRNKEQEKKDSKIMFKTAVAVPVAAGGAAALMSSKAIASDGRFTERFMNRVCDKIYKNSSKMPDEVKSLVETYFSNFHVKNDFNMENLLNMRVLETVIFKNSQREITGTELLKEFRDKAEAYVSGLYDFEKNKLVDQKAVLDDEQFLHKLLKKTVSKEKARFVKKNAWRSSVIAVFTVFLINKLKYILNSKKNMTSQKV